MTKRDPRLCRNRFVGFALPYIWIVPLERQEVGIDLALVDNRRAPTEAIDPRVKNFNWMDLPRGGGSRVEAKAATLGRDIISKLEKDGLSLD